MFNSELAVEEFNETSSEEFFIKIPPLLKNVTKQGGDYDKPCFFSQNFLACGAFELHVIDQL